jgi:hypothetical protein
MRAMRRAAVLVSLLAMTGTALADAKDPDTARLASGVGAAVAGGVTLAGFMTAPSGKPFNKPLLYTGIGALAIAPSAGEFYSGQYLTIGLGIRAAGAALAYYTLQTQTQVVTCDDASSSDQKCTGFTENVAPMLGIAAIIFVGGVWYDVLDAADSAKRYNKKHALLATPTAMQAPQGAVPGFVLSGSF